MGARLLTRIVAVLQHAYALVFEDDRVLIRVRLSGIGHRELLFETALSLLGADARDDVVAEGADQLWSIQEPLDLGRRAAVPDVRVLEDLRQRATALVLADHVRGHPVLLARPGEEKRERILEKRVEPRHRRRLYPGPMRKLSTASRFAERELHGFDESGTEERIVVWIERRQGGMWAVGRAVNPQHRTSDEPRTDDYVFEGHELEDVLEQANGILDDDVRVSEEDGRPEHIRPFTRKELLGPLERWFFGHR